MDRMSDRLSDYLQHLGVRMGSRRQCKSSDLCAHILDLKELLKSDAASVST